jgi:peptidoglycan/xylan/chitin deacetylase (PgdA/CDA1 family)
MSRLSSDSGHELGHHGWVHEPLSQLEREAERELLERGLDALDRVAGVRPRGYWAPSVDVSPNTVELRVEHGFLYDASFSGSDFDPYYLRRGDLSIRRAVRLRREQTPAATNACRGVCARASPA